MKSKLKNRIEKYIDIIYSIILFFTLFYSWFSIEKKLIISAICILMEIYVFYYGEKKLNKWAMFNVMIAFWRIVFII